MAVKVYLRLVAFRRRLHSSNDARLAGLVFSVVTGGPMTDILSRAEAAELSCSKDCKKVQPLGRR